MRKTQSEIVFERFCAMKGIVCLRIPARDTRTPDHTLEVAEERIIVEVKEIAPKEHPSILVVFDRGRVCGHVDAYNIRVAMYGLEPSARALICAE